MASTVALFTGLSGLTAQARSLEVIGNNISNVNTTGYKTTRVEFSDQIKQNLSLGSPPAESSGGTNPSQVGLGVRVGGLLVDTRQGGISATGDQRDMAIEGAGYFIVRRGQEQFYTRAGAFRPNSAQQLATPEGHLMLGYPADASFNIVEGGLSPIQIPLGRLTIAEATSTVALSGNLDADGALPTAGAVVRLGGGRDSTGALLGLRTIAGATAPPSAPNLVEPAGLLVELEDPALPGSGSPLFAAGQQFELDGAERGTAAVTVRRMTITAATTVQEFMDFLSGALGIQPASGANPDGRTPGVTLDPATGLVSVVGHTGTVNDLAIPAESLRVLDAAGALVRRPFATDQDATADGASVRTTVLAFDSLGAPVTANVQLVLESRDELGTTWRYYLDSPADESGASGLGTGTISFDSFGELLTTEPVTVSIDRPSAGASSPLEFDLWFSREDSVVTALAGESSTLAATFRDGREAGTLSDFTIDRDGTVLGAFTNSLVRPLGRVVLATFANPGGLVNAGSNLFRSGANTGEPVEQAPQTLGAGSIVSGALEQSNVDLGTEFIKMILTSTAYSASSRVIRTADELLQQLLVVGR